MTMFDTRHTKLSPDSLLELMESNDLSQAELAYAVGTSQPAIAQMVSGTRNITKKMTARIYDALEWYLAPHSEADKQAMKEWYEKLNLMENP